MGQGGIIPERISCFLPPQAIAVVSHNNINNNTHSRLNTHMHELVLKLGVALYYWYNRIITRTHNYYYYLLL